MSSFPNLECSQDKGYLVTTRGAHPVLSRRKILVEAYYYFLACYVPTKCHQFLMVLLKLNEMGAGLDDRHGLMVSSIRHALVRERIPVLCSLGLGAQHNHNLPLTPEGQKWETYFDLENVTAILYRQDDKAIMNVKPVKVLTLPRFFKQAWPQLLFGQQSKPKSYCLDDLPYGEDKSTILSSPIDHRRGKGLKSKLLKEHGLVIDIQIPPSQKVKSIAQGVVDKLRAEGNYCVLHIRRGDRLLISDELLDRATQPGAILDKVKDIFPEGAALYIMTDEWDRTFFDPLRARYRVRRYLNFPELAELVHGKTPNNHLLYAVEKQIASQSSKECRTFVDDETIQKNIPTLIDKDRKSMRVREMAEVRRAQMLRL